MNEITPAERVALDTLRATALAKMSDADFANLETEVASKGLQNLDGWFGAQVAKAVEQVLKHPGHANQASHGGKGGGGASSAPASSGGGGGGASSPQAQVDAITGSPEFKASSQKLNDTVEAHRVAVQNSKLPKSVKQEADNYLIEVQVARREMNSAKTPSELSRAHGKAVDAGENYKGTIRAYEGDQRAAHYRKPMASPYKAKSVLPKGLEDYDVQDVADSMPIPFAD